MIDKGFLYKSLDVIAAFFIALVISYLITPTVRVFAKRLGFVDRPTDEKVHRHATPLLGGLAIYIGYFLAVVFTLGFDRDILSIFLGGTMLAAVGIFDDRYGMMPKVKLFGQLIAALTVVKMGIKVEFIGNYYLASVFSCIWIIGITNAINLVDGLDGLSGGITAISAFFFGLLSWERGDFSVAVLAMALCGASLGFLRYNFPRAFVFMGDTGSLFIGFLLAVIAIKGSWASPSQLTSAAMPVFILGYPIFDTALVILSRIKEGRYIFQGGQDHPHHRLVLMGLKKTHAVVLIFVITFFLGLSGYMMSKIKSPATAIRLTVAVFAAMAVLATRLFMVDPYIVKRKVK